MNDTEGERLAEIADAFRSVRRRLQGLTVAVIVMALLLFLTAATVFGYVVDYHAGEALLRGAVGVGAALVGFVAGWFARRIARE